MGELRPPRDPDRFLQTPPHPSYSRSALVGFRFPPQLLPFRSLCPSDMSMLFCSWASKDEEIDDDQDVDDEDQKSDSKEEEKEKVEEISESVSEKEELREESKENDSSPSK